MIFFQYGDYIGRFMCVDKLWGKYLSWTPYNYCGNKNSIGKEIHNCHKYRPIHPDPKDWESLGHVPGVTNPDGTPWLPIKNVSPPK